MSGQDIGYIRISSTDQNDERQLSDIKLDRIFTDKISGKNTNRPSFTEMSNYARDGDIIHVHSIDRLARNLVDLRQTVTKFLDKGVSVKFHKENLFFSKKSDNPIDNLLLSILGAFAEFERTMIRDRQREGIRIAQKKGTYNGRLPMLTKTDTVNAHRDREKGVPVTLLARRYSVSRTTMYRYLEDVDKWKLTYKKEDLIDKK